MIFWTKLVFKIHNIVNNSIFFSPFLVFVLSIALHIGSSFHELNWNHNKSNKLTTNYKCQVDWVIVWKNWWKQPLVKRKNLGLFRERIIVAFLWHFGKLNFTYFGNLQCQSRPMNTRITLYFGCIFTMQLWHAIF